jgi:hypothetical protein
MRERIVLGLNPFPMRWLEISPEYADMFDKAGLIDNEHRKSIDKSSGIIHDPVD